MAVIIVLSFALFMYPIAPRCFGGGRPSDVRLFLNATSSQFQSPLVAQLVYQTPDSVLVNATSGIFLIKQEQIDSIQYIKTGSILEMPVRQ